MVLMLSIGGKREDMQVNKKNKLDFVIDDNKGDNLLL